MATYKAEALHQKHDVLGARGARAATTCSAGCRSGRALAAPMAPVANRMMKLGPVARLAKATAGIDQRRSIPAFAPKTLRSVPTGVARRRRRTCGSGPTPSPTTSSRATGCAAIRYLESVGVTARVIADDACCGLTWITTGQLDQARSIMERTVAHAHAVRRVGRAGRRPGAVLPGHPAQRRRRADRREPRRADLRRAGRAARRAAAGPVRRRGRRAAALPPGLDPRLGRRQAAAGEGGRHASPRSPAAAGWPATSAWRRATTRCRSPSPRPTCCPPYARNPDAVVLADGMSCRVQLDDLDEHSDDAPRRAARF